LIPTLLITILVEGIVGAGYCLGQRKPFGPILLSSVFINLVTQSLLWLVLNLFFFHYLAALLAAEILIWIVESFLLYSIPGNQLHFRGAILLSLFMNLASFALGWFLPV